MSSARVWQTCSAVRPGARPVVEVFDHDGQGRTGGSRCASRLACGRRRARRRLGFHDHLARVRRAAGHRQGFAVSHYANDGAPAYNRFLDGLDASRTVESDPHRTAIGHSYGTTLIGSAARQGDHVTADNDETKHSVNIVHFAKNKTPN